ncbi:MAG: ATP-binding protein [Deltaproteobacteria bacterium]|nr:ATP-binding protein [Deltaproteobacteria bacterium]
MERLLVDADPARLREVSSFAAKDLPPGYLGAASRVELAVEEIFINICLHAYRGEKGPVSITRALCPDGEGGECLVITLKDGGRPFNPFEDAPPPDLDGDLEQRRVGGLGIHLVKRMADRFFHRGTGEGNETELRFSRRGE